MPIWGALAQTPFPGAGRAGSRLSASAALDSSIASLLTGACTRHGRAAESQPQGLCATLSRPSCCRMSERDTLSYDVAPTLSQINF